MDAALTALGKYQLRGTLGRGAMGIVYDGWDPQIARRVAIKTVPLPAVPDAETEEEIARFKREAQAAGRLSHPNIVGVYDYGEASGLAYIVMEFVDGPPLKALLDRQERFALPRIGRLMEELLAGLQFSHERGVVHRDIKPANVMLTADGQVKITDFGIARIETSSMTQTGSLLGTPAAMSPEQFRGEVADARTDVYAAGVLLYQLLTGARPFEGSLNAIMHKVLTSEPPPPSALAATAPAALDAVVQRAMAKRPADRFPSAAAFAAAIRTALAAAPPAGAARAAADAAVPAAERTMRGAARPSPAPRARAKAGIAAGALAAALLVLAGGAWLVLRPAPSSVVPAARAPAAPPLRPPPAPAAAGAPAHLAMALPLREQVAQALSAARCALAESVVQDSGRIEVFGVAGSDDARALRQRLDRIGGTAHPVDWQVHAVAPVFCAALALLRPLTPQGGAPDAGLALTLADGRTALRDGERILPRLTMPHFAGEVRVDYLADDGSAVHLYPAAAEPQRAVAAQPARQLAAGERLALGDPGPGRQVWEVGPPYGTDMIIAVASSLPLPLRAPAQNAEDDAAGYLRDLAAAIDAARQAGARLAGTVLLVDTVPK